MTAPAATPGTQGNRSKSALILLFDALRFDTMSDPVARKFLFPNLAKIADRGVVNRVVANAQSTQFVMPSIFSLTYPLDHGGYDTGIRLRPKSFVEVLKKNGWTTHKMVTVNELGGHHGYGRGFDTIQTATDFRVVLEHNLDRTLSYQIKLWKNGEVTEKEALKVFCREFELVLKNLEETWNSYDHSLWTRTLRKINKRVAKGLATERLLLKDDPRAVMNKVASLSGAAYWRFLGESSINPAKRFFWHGVGFIKHHSKNAIASRMFPPFFLLGHYPLVMSDIIDNICKLMNEKRGQKWAAYIHLMDLHDCRAFNRPFHVIARWRFLPRWWIGRVRGFTQRRFTYDTALMAADVSVGKILAEIERTGQSDSVSILVTGDHGSFYAENPRLKKPRIQVRTHSRGS